MDKRARVLIDCDDQKGLVYKISKVFFEMDLNIDSNQEFVEYESKRFFMRSVVSGEFELDRLRQNLINILPKEANIKVVEPSKKDIVLMATKESHALGDILIRYIDGELRANIKCVIANRDNLRDLVERFNIPFIYISSDNISREEHEKLILKELQKYRFDYIVLAKYMRILTPYFVSKYPFKIINIHHSFLPAFIGANPYKQAYERGVKIIGATAHFVTDDLDEGPIIAQDVIEVNHRFSWKDMQQAGRDVEKVVLSRALKYVLDDRVFVYNNKTIVF
ncbi:MAG: formyltetrahydrofolate deformylase [Epsilonproteobacteria bacterium]|nr:formyltetrahydrofolate deformylase [Campylobacterota bacterium]